MVIRGHYIYLKLIHRASGFDKLLLYVLKMIADSLNETIREVITPYPNGAVDWRALMGNGSWSGTLGYLQREHADLFQLDILLVAIFLFISRVQSRLFDPDYWSLGKIIWMLYEYFVDQKNDNDYPDHPSLSGKIMLTVWALCQCVVMLSLYRILTENYFLVVDELMRKKSVSLREIACSRGLSSLHSCGAAASFPWKKRAFARSERCNYVYIKEGLPERTTHFIFAKISPWLPSWNEQVVLTQQFQQRTFRKYFDSGFYHSGPPPKCKEFSWIDKWEMHWVVHYRPKLFRLKLNETIVHFSHLAAVFHLNIAYFCVAKVGQEGKDWELRRQSAEKKKMGKDDELPLITSPPSPSNRGKHGKREDLQVIRGIAIIAVLAFHLLPTTFPNGYLGVDMFFVLSGFLMSTILCKSTLTSSSIVDFFVRRFKRIIPLYTMMLVSTTVATVLIFTISDMDNFIADVKWALAIATNWQIVLRKVDYWTKVFDYQVLLHAWSLGVELQYYLIVPFIVLFRTQFLGGIGRLLLFLAIFFSEFCVFQLVKHTQMMFKVEQDVYADHKWNVKERATTQLVLVVSYFFHLSLSSMVSFGALHARMWQFAIGHIINEYCQIASPPNEKSDQEVSNSPAPSFIITLSLMLAVLFPLTINPTPIRLFISLFTGFLICNGSRKGQLVVMPSKFLEYMGDISYVVYLVHWPIIVLCKYHRNVYELATDDVLNCFALTVFISVIVHHSIEQYFIRGPFILAAITTALIYSFLCSAIFNGEILKQPNAGTKTLYDEAIKFNLENSNALYFNKPPGSLPEDTQAVAWTNYTEEAPLRTYVPGNGTASVLLIGNSYAYRAFPVILRLFEGRFKEFRFLAHSGCLVLSARTCYLSNAIHTVIEKQKPDITFVIAKDLHYLEPINGNVSDDIHFKQTQDEVNIYSKHSGKVVIDLQYVRPNVTGGVSYTVAKRLQQANVFLEDLKITYEEYRKIHEPDLIRMQALKAPNLILNQVAEQMCSARTNTCWFYNRQNLRAYYGDWDAHLTTEGLKLLEPGYSKIIEDFLSAHKS
ncbi:hypothetical protein PRIPAC_95312 [Pristionchus pacificus]|uniref:Acyltransferase n=1 Tax=Pristionchus pacificus TaxID=54126 RepID=A0A2A6CTK7_PRIPA|nr:hypothetical protein PRIPAC_95312 [Pristionchus pacificus]|eukprot:PDM81562.1 Acyltransferase [Pristionchus pacificus]